MSGAHSQDTLCQVWFKDAEITDIVKKQLSWLTMFPPTETEQEGAKPPPSLREFVTAVGRHQGKDVLDKNKVMIENERLIQLSQVQDSITWLVLYVSSFIDDLQSDKEVRIRNRPNHEILVLDWFTCFGRFLVRISCVAGQSSLLLPPSTSTQKARLQALVLLPPPIPQQDYKPDTENSDPDTGVTLLNKFYYEMEEKIKDYLPTTHTKFLFEGLGYVMSAIVIDNACNIKEINSAGIKKMSRNILALQQNLTNITLTCELELERARFYYELLYLKPEVRDNNLEHCSRVFRNMTFPGVDVDAILLSGQCSDHSSRALRDARIGSGQCSDSDSVP
eukprot:sb/3466568/